MVRDFIKEIRNLSNKTEALPESQTDRLEMKDGQSAPVITLPEMDEHQIKELCEQIELLRGEYLTLTEKLYGEQDIIDPFFICLLYTSDAADE